MKKIVTIFVSLIICFAVIAFSAIRIFNLNIRYPSPTVVTHKMHELVNGGNVSVCVNRCELLGGSEIKKQFPNYTDETENPDGTKVTGKQIKTLLIYIIVKNNTSKIQSLSFAQMYAELHTWSNGIEPEIYQLLNKNQQDPTRVDIAPNKTVSFVLPYTMYDFQLKNSEWNNLKVNQFDLTLSAYPTKHVILL